VHRWTPAPPFLPLAVRPGVFSSLAFDMLLAAVDPGGRHDPFVALLLLSGYRHPAAMTVGGLLWASTGEMNRNPEHLHGDALG